VLYKFLSLDFCNNLTFRKGRKGKGRKGKGRKGKEREGKGRKGKEREGKGRKGKEREGKGRKGKERRDVRSLTRLRVKSVHNLHC
jgi:hypothetical protein